MWSFALKTLIADRGKFATTLVGVVFSIVLVNMQGGLFLGFIKRASLLVEIGEADIWVGHKHMSNVDFPQDIPNRWEYRVRSVPGVAAVHPYVIGASTMTLPSGSFEQVVVVGSDPASLVGTASVMSEGRRADIRQPDGIIVDVYEKEKLEHPTLGEVREIGRQRARIVGFSRGIVGFLINPYVFTTLDRARAYVRKPADACSYFLVELEPTADASHVCREIQARLPEVDAYPSGDYANRTIDYWMTRTGLGISFGFATLLGLLVGLVIVAQTMYASALDRLNEFGALKAMGASDLQFCTLLIMQSVTIALCGTICGLSVTILVQQLSSTPHAPIVIPTWLSLGSAGLVLGLCLISSLLPYLRIRKIDPLLVLQS